MQKYIKIISVLLSLVFVFSGCGKNSENIDSANSDTVKKKLRPAKEEVIVDNFILEATRHYDDIEDLKLVEEDESLLKEKEEFLQLFKEFCGFSLPEYFIIPKITKETSWNMVCVTTRYISISLDFVVEKNDALRMLELLKNDKSWGAYYDRAGEPAITQEERENKAKHFEKSRRRDFSLGGKWVDMSFTYDKDNDVYILEMYASLQRDPPPGTYWPPEIYM